MAVRKGLTPLNVVSGLESQLLVSLDAGTPQTGRYVDIRGELTEYLMFGPTGASADRFVAMWEDDAIGANCELHTCGIDLAAPEVGIHQWTP